MHQMIEESLPHDPAQKRPGFFLRGVAAVKQQLFCPAQQLQRQPATRVTEKVVSLPKQEQGKGPRTSVSPAAPLLVGRETAASLVALSVATWDRLTAAGKTPAPVKLGGRVLWRTSDLELWTNLGCPDRKTFVAMTDPRET